MSQTLISELQQILISDFGINANIKQAIEIGDSLTKFSKLLLNMKKNDKSKTSIKI